MHVSPLYYLICMHVLNCCIFCQSSSNFETVEHIVPRSLGNLHYILPRGTVCSHCNGKFARFENRVVSSKLFMDERRRFNLVRARNQIDGIEMMDRDLKKFLLKMAFESIYASRPKVWKQHDFTDLLNFLLQGKESQIFTSPPDLARLIFTSIPGLIERSRLRNNRLHLEMAEDGARLYFQFQFGQLRSVLRIA